MSSCVQSDTLLPLYYAGALEPPLLFGFILGSQNEATNQPEEGK